MKKNKNKSKRQISKILEDHSITLSKAEGNGVLRRLIRVDNKGAVIHYSLAYINHALCNKDNGRVLGYDNKHGFHHRHYMGKVEEVDFKNFLAIEETFQQEFEVLHAEAKKKK